MQRVLSAFLLLCSFSVVADETVLKLYRPFGEVTEQVVPVIKRKLSGHCLAQSHLILREDAWRCQAEGQLYDPCFVQEAGSRMEAVCPQSPWAGDSVQIVVNAPLNNQQHVSLDMSRAFPWGIELVNGEYCQAVDSDELYDGLPVRYRCSGQNRLIGSLQRCKEVWSMLERRTDEVSTAGVRKAWF